MDDVKRESILKSCMVRLRFRDESQTGADLFQKTENLDDHAGSPSFRCNASGLKKIDKHGGWILPPNEAGPIIGLFRKWIF